MKQKVLWTMILCSILTIGVFAYFSQNDTEDFQKKHRFRTNGDDQVASKPMVTTSNKDTLNDCNDLTALKIVLPAGWSLDDSDKRQYNFIDGNSDGDDDDDDDDHKVGWIIAEKYKDNVFTEWKPNHSEIIEDECIEIPLGKCRVFTLDVDNGTAASGIIGTHHDYYAIIPVKNNIRYVLELSQKDEKIETRDLFIKILKELSFNR